jgi:ribosomal protein L37E
MSRLTTITGDGREDSVEVTSCERCGSEWFDLVREDGRPGAVTLDATGKVTGRVGELRCNECGTDVGFRARPTLRVTH